MWQTKSHEDAAAVVPEVAPVEVEAVRVVRPLRGRAEPEVVVEARQGGAESGGDAEPELVGRPSRRRALMIVPEHARADDLDDAAVVVARVDQVPHLGDAAVLGRGVGHRPPLADPVREGLLAVDVLARLAGEDRRDRVPVVGRGDDHRVDVLAVEDARGSRCTTPACRRPSPAPCRVRLVDVADGGDADVGHLAEDVQQARAHPAEADEAERDRVVGRGLRRRRLVAPGEARRDRGRGGGEELASGRWSHGACLAGRDGV